MPVESYDGRSHPRTPRALSADLRRGAAHPALGTPSPAVTRERNARTTRPLHAGQNPGARFTGAGLVENAGKETCLGRAAAPLAGVWFECENQAFAEAFRSATMTAMPFGMTVTDASPPT
ncbi:hypothetical protein SDC9_105555 [bioreactor metagenome]|uniref:Uncharacterized protein n=1 Tax=bioreactor metagenome TaxID=1076179 RepID=A0A645AZU7_9ZZZZ